MLTAHGEIDTNREKIDNFIEKEDETIPYEKLLSSLQQSGGVWDIKKPEDDEKSIASTTVSRLIGYSVRNSAEVRDSRNF